MGRRKTLAEKSDGEAWRSKVVKAQQQICRFIKANVGREDPFDEKAIIEAVKKRLVDQGASDFEAQDQGIRLRTFGGENRPIKRAKVDDRLSQGRGSLSLTEEIFTAGL